MIGILAYGSLIADPGWEIKELTHHVISEIETPFAVEYARRSNTRSGAPTLVPVKNEKGIPVRAIIFVLTQGTDIKTAKNILYRREKHMVGNTNKTYQPPKAPDADTVIVEQIDNLFGVETVLSTRIGVNIHQILDDNTSDESKAELLATFAINSVTSKTFLKNEDGISYLANAVEAGVITRLTKPYRQAILRLTDNSPSLGEARLWVAKRNKITTAKNMK